jgi:hypothetical protein
MSEYGDLKTHMPNWSINVTPLKSIKENIMKRPEYVDTRKFNCILRHAV